MSAFYGQIDTQIKSCLTCLQQIDGHLRKETRIDIDALFFGSIRRCFIHLAPHLCFGLPIKNLKNAGRRLDLRLRIQWPSIISKIGNLEITLPTWMNDLKSGSLNLKIG